MTNYKLINTLATAMIVISCAMLIWTVNYISNSSNTHFPTAISAYHA